VILDILENLERYRGLGPRLDQGLEALRALAVGKSAGFPLADGRHELAGADLYAIVSSYLTEAPEAKPFEAHRSYLDIQVVLQGRETLQAEEGLGVALEPGLFVVLFPQDGHRPGCHPAGEEAQAVRKIVLKVRIG
jgi:biofilm protein TabA